MLKPLKNHIVLKKQKPAEKTESGLFRPDSAKTEAEYVVESVGAEVKQVKKGDKVVFKEYSGTNVKINDEEYVVVKEEDVLATF
ncbi:co-chaperone GroES [Candidatus Saccharibacteria bacterium]|nr:co-chaperone GroES [Candidatus Saccharibacteria bacterium]